MKYFLACIYNFTPVWGVSFMWYMFTNMNDVSALYATVCVVFALGSYVLSKLPITNHAEMWNNFQRYYGVGGIAYSSYWIVLIVALLTAVFSYCMTFLGTRSEWPLIILLCGAYLFARAIWFMIHNSGFSIGDEFTSEQRKRLVNLYHGCHMADVLIVWVMAVGIHVMMIFAPVDPMWFAGLAVLTFGYILFCLNYWLYKMLYNIFIT